MKTLPGKPSNQRGSVQWALLLFLLGFCVLLVLTALLWVMPAVDAARDATPEQRKALVAMSRLLLALLLVILLIGLILIFRVRRYFQVPPHGRTEYPDAWAESARRLKPPADDQP